MTYTHTVNAYFATLLITIAGACAALLIIHVANDSTLATTFVSGGSHYHELQKSILK